MNPVIDPAYVAFEGDRRIGSGSLRDVARAAREALDRRQDASILVFEGGSSAPVDIDLRGSIDDVLARIPPVLTLPADEDIAIAAPRGPGRPKLGVVAREITLLPRHWDWLASQPGGASVALRKLVEHARRANGDKDRVRMAREVAYRFMSAMAGDLRNLEEASRALFAGEAARFYSLVAAWPEDIRDHTVKLAVDGLA